MFGFLSEGFPLFYWEKLSASVLQDFFPGYLHVVPLRCTFKVFLSAVSLSIGETESDSFPWVRAPQLFPIDEACDHYCYLLAGNTVNESGHFPAGFQDSA